MKNPIRSLVVAGSALVLAGSFGVGTPVLAGSPAKTMPTAHVKIVDSAATIGAFKANTIKVHKGQHIVFKNTSSAAHTVTSDKSGVFDSKNLDPGKSWTYKATHIGTFKYHCMYHPLMVGKIVVTK